MPEAQLHEIKKIKFLSSESPVDNIFLERLPEEIILGGEEQAEKLKNYVKFINKIIDADNLVVLAGSGTSLTFNSVGREKIAPSMWDLWDVCNKFDPHLARQVLAAVKYSHAAPSLSDGTIKQDIELLLSLCDSYLSLNCLSKTRQNQLSRFLRSAKIVIREKTDFTTKVLPQNWAAHDRFIKVLGRRNPKQKRLKLFTTNYDLAFETAASNTGMIVIDGFEYSNPARFNPAWFTYDVVNRMQATEKGGAYLANVFHLYKIHGSVDWVRLPSGIQKRSFSSDSGEPVFIYPSSSKYQTSYDSPYLDMMAAFLDAVQKPKTALICIGFGFNDKHINNAITMALRTNPEFILMAATKDPFNISGAFNADIRDLMLRAINAGDSRIAIADCTFDIFSALLPERNKLAPEEQLFKAFEKIVSSDGK